MHKLERALRGSGCNAEIENAGYSAIEEIKKLSTENARFRVALEAILAVDKSGSTIHLGPTSALQMRIIANEALKQPE